MIDGTITRESQQVSVAMPTASPATVPGVRTKRAWLRWTPLGLALAMAAWAIGGSLLVFPLLSDNNDEAIYLLQANSLLEGNLFPPAPAHWEAFLPWLSVRQENRYVTKYSPVHATILAASKFLVGTERAALGLIAFAVVTTAYLLAKEVLGSRRKALLAAAFFSLSPAILIQSTMFLSYLSALALMQGFAAAMLIALRMDSARLLVLSGFLAGLAVFSRPFEAILFGLPLAGWLIFTHRHDPKWLLAKLGGLAAGACLPVLGMLWFFNQATGNLFEHPFHLLDPLDRFGFGERRMIPEWGSTQYNLGAAWSGFTRHMALISFWFFGGLPIFGLALAGLRWFRPAKVATWLLMVAVTVPFGYLFFWGSFGSTEWGGPSRFGPFYYLPMLTPLAILGAQGFFRMWSWDRRIGAAAAAAMALLSMVVTVRAVHDNGLFTQERRRIETPLRTAELKNAIVFLPQLQGPWLLQPFAIARNPSFDGEVLWALDRGHDFNLDVLTEFPTRTPYLLRAEGRHRDMRPTLDFTTSLEKVEVARGAPLEVEVAFTEQPITPIRIEVSAGRRVDSFLYDPGARAVNGDTLVLEVGVGSTEFVDPPLERETRPSMDMESGLEVTAWRIEPDGSEVLVARDQHELRYRGRVVEMLLPSDSRLPDTGAFDLEILPRRQ